MYHLYSLSGVRIATLEDPTSHCNNVEGLGFLIKWKLNIIRQDVDCVTLEEDRNLQMWYLQVNFLTKVLQLTKEILQNLHPNEAQEWTLHRQRDFNHPFEQLQEAIPVLNDVYLIRFGCDEDESNPEIERCLTIFRDRRRQVIEQSFIDGSVVVCTDSEAEAMVDFNHTLVAREVCLLFFLYRLVLNLPIIII